MKFETGSFTPASSTVGLNLWDSTMNVKGVYLQTGANLTTQAEGGEGFSDGTRNRSKAILVNSSKRETKRSTTAAIIHYKDVSGTTTKVVEGKVATGGFGTTGQITFDFPTYDSTTVVDYMAFGD